LLRFRLQLVIAAFVTVIAVAVAAQDAPRLGKAPPLLSNISGHPRSAQR